MKRIYFVRHGFTVANQNRTLQGLDDTLTPEGEMQASRVAERVSTLPVDLCVSSDALRARQTSSYIESVLKMPFIYSPLFREWAVPSSYIGMDSKSALYQAFLRDRENNDDAWHFEDEENFVDRTARTRKALDFLIAQEAQDILVVTHGMFLRFVVSTMILEGEMTLALWRKLNGGFKSANTGITVCTHDGNRWCVLTWNDHAHFGENVFNY